MNNSSKKKKKKRKVWKMDNKSLKHQKKEDCSKLIVF